MNAEDISKAVQLVILPRATNTGQSDEPPPNQPPPPPPPPPPSAEDQDQEEDENEQEEQDEEEQPDEPEVCARSIWASLLPQSSGTETVARVTTSRKNMTATAGTVIKPSSLVLSEAAHPHSHSHTVLESARSRTQLAMDSMNWLTMSSLMGPVCTHIALHLLPHGLPTGYGQRWSDTGAHSPYCMCYRKCSRCSAT